MRSKLGKRIERRSMLALPEQGFDGHGISLFCKATGTEALSV